MEAKRSTLSTELTPSKIYDMPAIHTLRAERRTLHGHFSRDLDPVLTIQSGDTVQFTTLDSNWGMEPYVGGPYAPRREFEGRLAG
jgi:hypothetical protein